MSKKFAVFDVDGTLVRWQFFHAIVHELGHAGHLSATSHDAVRAARMRWKVRSHPESFREYESILVHTYLDALKDISEADHNAAINAVFTEYREQLFTYTRDLLQHLKAQGYTLFAISGSHEQIIAKLATELGFDDYIGAHFEFSDGKYTGQGSTPVHDKATAVRSLVEKHGCMYKASLAIGDSESDIAMLALVDTPIAFNPSRGLYEAAQQHGWDIVIERKNVVYTLQAKDGHYILK